MKLAIFSIIVEAFKFCWLNRIQFYLLALPAITILAISSTLITNFVSDTSQQAFEFKLLGEPVVNSKETFRYSFGGSSRRPIAELLLFFSLVAFFTIYSVAWHRFFLVPKEKLNILECYLWRRRHSLFLWSNIKIFLLIIPIGCFALVVTLFSALLAPLFVIAAIFFVSVLYARFSMWLPAAALDRSMTLRAAFVLTKGNGGQLAAILILTGIIGGILDSIATSLIGYASVSLSTIGVLTQDLLTNFALYLIMYAGMAIGITALSMGYQLLTDANNPNQENM